MSGESRLEAKKMIRYQYNASQPCKAIDFITLGSKVYLLFQDYLQIHDRKYQIEGANRIQSHHDQGLFTVSGATLQVYDPSTIQQVFDFELQCVNHSLKGPLIACCLKNQVRICDLRTGSSVQSIKTSPAVLQLSDQREYLLLVGGPALQLFDLRMYRLIAEYSIKDVNCCSFNSHLVIGSQKGKRGSAIVKIFNLYNSELMVEQSGHLNNKRDWIECLSIDSKIFYPSDCGSIYMYGTGPQKSDSKMMGHLSDCFAIKESELGLISLAKNSIIDWMPEIRARANLLSEKFNH